MKIVKESKFDNGDKVRLIKDSLVSKVDTGEVLFVAYEMIGSFTELDLIAVMNVNLLRKIGLNLLMSYILLN